jgi:septal ring factor EnvC (AmiA/AmiB activator)
MVRSRLAAVLVLACALPIASGLLAASDSTTRAAAMPATAEGVMGVLERLGADDRRTGERLDALARESATLHALVLGRGRAYAKMARAGLLPVGGGIAGLVDHAARLERLRRALSRDLAREQAIAKERLELAKARATLDDRRALLEVERAALERSHTAILAAGEREEAFRRAFLGVGAASPHTAIYGSGVGPLDADDLAQGFAALRGRLSFPIEGRVEVRSASWPGADGPGLEMIAVQSAVVRAVYPGRVAFADSYSDYGKTIIVEHGNGYYTVSANLAELDVKAGDEVKASEPIGRIGATARGAVLYFEIRRGAQTVKPEPWFGI